MSKRVGRVIIENITYINKDNRLHMEIRKCGDDVYFKYYEYIKNNVKNIKTYLNEKLIEEEKYVYDSKGIILETSYIYKILEDKVYRAQYTDTIDESGSRVTVIKNSCKDGKDGHKTLGFQTIKYYPDSCMVMESTTTNLKGDLIRFSSYHHGASGCDTRERLVDGVIFKDKRFYEDDINTHVIHYVDDIVKSCEYIQYNNVNGIYCIDKIIYTDSEDIDDIRMIKYFKYNDKNETCSERIVYKKEPFLSREDVTEYEYKSHDKNINIIIKTIQKYSIDTKTNNILIDPPFITEKIFDNNIIYRSVNGIPTIDCDIDYYGNIITKRQYDSSGDKTLTKIEYINT